MRIRRLIRIGLTASAVGCATESAPPPDPGDSGLDPPAPVVAELPDTQATAVDSMPADPGAEWKTGDTSIPGAAGIAVMRAARTARHDAFDRMVFEFEDVLPGYRISYIDRPVRQCGSGDVVPFEGDAWLSLVFEPSAAHTEEGRATIAERTRRPALPNVIEFKLICDFEAQVEWVAGVHSPMEYRVFTLTDPARIVVDVRHPDRNR